MKPALPRLVLVARCALLLAAGTGATGAVLRVVADTVRPAVLGLRDHGGDALPLTDAVAAIAAAALLACWLRVGCLGAALTLRVARDALRGGGPHAVPVARPGRAPRLVHRIVLVAVGLGASGGFVLPAHAEPAGRPSPQTVAARAGALTGLALPDRTAGAGARRRPPAPAVLTVHPGDSLWSIAVGLAPEGAGPGQVAATWSRLCRANAARLGDRPDLIFPGTHLVVPRHDLPGKEQP